MSLAALLFGQAARAESSDLIGSTAPELSLPAGNGHGTELYTLRGNKKTLLTFFTSWSKSGVAELAALAELRQANKARVEVVAVSYDKKSKELKDYLAAAGLAFPVLHDKKLTTIDSFQITVIPTTFCIGADGAIEKVFVDYDENVQKALEEWLK